VELPDFETFWSQGYVEVAEPTRQFVAFEAFREEKRRAERKRRDEELGDVWGYDLIKCSSRVIRSGVPIGTLPN